MRKLAYLGLAALLVPGSLAAQIVIGDTPITAAPTQGTPAAKGDLDKVECRQQETIGSRLQRHKVCLTKQQWIQAEQDNRRKVQELQELTPARPSG